LWLTNPQQRQRCCGTNGVIFVLQIGIKKWHAGIAFAKAAKGPDKRR
jgi:hypothetical protein